MGVQLFGRMDYHCVLPGTDPKNVTISDLAIPDTMCSKKEGGGGYECPEHMECMKLDMSAHAEGFYGMFNDFASSLFTVYMAASQEGWVLRALRLLGTRCRYVAFFYFVTLIFFLAWLVKNPGSDSGGYLTQKLERGTDGWQLVDVDQYARTGNTPELLHTSMRHLYTTTMNLTKSEKKFIIMSRSSSPVNSGVSSSAFDQSLGPCWRISYIRSLDQAKYGAICGHIFRWVSLAGDADCALLFVAVILDNLEMDEELKKVKQLKAREENSMRTTLPWRLRVFDQFPTRPQMAHGEFPLPKIRHSFTRQFADEPEETTITEDNEEIMIEGDDCSKRLMASNIYSQATHRHLRLRHIGRISERNIVNRILDQSNRSRAGLSDSSLLVAHLSRASTLKAKHISSQ
ncbi:unnamed protein product, partial [Mesorhabditis spiculigera]